MKNNFYKELYIKAFKNAQDLFEESNLLHLNGHFSRAYFLANCIIPKR